jgi:hypothetical protein
MGILWGRVTENKDLGVVAEQCPSCERVTPCRVRAACHGVRVLFVRLTSATRDTTCVCTACGGSFPCELWRYPCLVPAQEASALPVEDLLARTNPGLADRVQLKEQVSALGGDDRFAAAYEHLDGMRPGVLHSGLLKQLLDWGKLKDEQRTYLVERAETCARAWRLARRVAPGFPGHAGCLAAFLVALVFWTSFLWAPIPATWLAVIGTVIVGCAAAALTGHLLLARRVRRWTREVLITEAQRANASLLFFLAVVDELPLTRHCVLDELWPVKNQIETIRDVLTREGKL